MSAAVDVDWNQRRTNTRMGIANPALPVSAVVAQPARPGPMMASAWQRRKAAELGTSIPAGSTQGQAASIIKAAMTPAPKAVPAADPFDTEWAALMAALPEVTPTGRWAHIGA